MAHLPLAVTMGDPAGIGGDITLAAWSLRAQRPTRPFFLIDDADRLEKLGGELKLNVPLARITAPEEAVALFDQALPVLHRPLPRASQPGKPHVANAPAVVASIEEAVTLCRANRAGGMVTNPIAKHVLYESGFRFPGHTEFLAELAGGVRVVMMLACAELRVVPVTIHVSLRQAIALLKVDEIVACGRLTAEGLRRDFGIAHPRIAVAGLNPHAGENRAMGDEDETIVKPAVAILRGEGVDARGPLPPDTMFHARARQTYDAALCMYHDQALIPIKTIDFDGGVNLTLGLPFLRGSPDHGTAFDIAGTGRARPDSLIAALALVGEIAARHGH